jgi:(1->4)-alpha-D-glucan 1-alpha-D-glucosylmutase
VRATYRLQLTAAFGFDAARRLIPYLRDLGLSHLYLSPSLEARAGSTHGYDVIDPERISDALGGERGLRALSAAARGAGMGIVLDVVPNHMAADEGNRYWADPELRKRFFDIDPATGRHRRFFDIDDLAGVRQEDPLVFEETHRLVLGLVAEGVVDGLRVDHPDGLADPAGYLGQLRERGAERVWVEKILNPSERLRHWPVTGTVGYEFLNDVAALFVDPAGERELTSLWEQVSGDPRPFGEVAFEARLEQVTTTFGPEVERLARVLGREPDSALRHALSALPIYRTYVEPSSGRVEEADRAAIIAADMDPVLASLLTLERSGPEEFVTRFQQTTPAVMAKGVEDTAFYRYGRLLALNDVGGDPSRFGVSVARFHEAALEREERFPLGLLTTQTHDCKRSADVRARIGVLASMTAQWREHVDRWFAIGEALLGGAEAPDRIEQYFLFQTLVGAWPIEVERVEAYMEKALREGKRNTSWVAQNHEWEGAVKRFARALVAAPEFLADFEPFVAQVSLAGDRAALGQVVLKLTAPGVPDIYQGDELPYLALVDPDNRRPVDFEWRRAMLARLMGGSTPDAKTRKMWLILRLLTLRARKPHIFAAGYEALDAGDETCAFMRGDGLLVIVHTRPGLPDDSLEAPGGRWRDVLRGEERSFAASEPVAGLVDSYGVAVFERLGR